MIVEAVLLIKKFIYLEMFSLDSLLFYIPVKSKSERLPNKNLQLLGGKHLFEHSIDIAIKLAKSKSHIYVSSESKKIRDICRVYPITFLERSLELSKSDVKVSEVLAYDLPKIIEMHGKDMDIVLLLPTSPFRQISEIKDAYFKYKKAPDYSRLVSVSKYKVPLEHALIVDNVQRAKALFDDSCLNIQSQTQSHKEMYYPNGSLYILSLQSFFNDPVFFKSNETLAYISSFYSSIDIDTHNDIQLAEALYSKAMKYDVTEEIL